jgi:hypothetical protein
MAEKCLSVRNFPQAVTLFLQCAEFESAHGVFCEHVAPLYFVDRLDRQWFIETLAKL